MAELGDIARITPLNKSIKGELPNVDDPDDLRVAAELVHKFFHTKQLVTPVSTVRERGKRPGREWQGRIRPEVFEKLWPRLKDRVLVTEEEAYARTGIVLDYMERSGILVCVRPSYRDVPAKWWVSDHFTPLIITQMETEPVTQTATEALFEESADKTVAESSEEEAKLVCREPECGAKFTAGQARSGHEHGAHKMVARPNGERFYYNDEAFTTQYIIDTIVELLKGSEKPVTFYGLWDLAVKKDPRLGKSILRDHLGEMVNAGVVSQGEQGSATVFSMVTEEAWSKPIQGLLETLVEDRTKRAKEKESTATWTTPVASDLKTGIAYAQHVMSTAMGNIKTVQEAIDALVQYAAAKDQEIAKLRIQLMGSPKESSELKQLKEKLAQTEQERDLYKSKVEAFDRALAGLRVQ